MICTKIVLSFILLGFWLVFIYFRYKGNWYTFLLYHKISNLSRVFSKKIQDINKCCNNKQVKIAGKGYGDNVGRIEEKEDVSKMGVGGLGGFEECSAHSPFASLDKCSVRNLPPAY